MLTQCSIANVLSYLGGNIEVVHSEKHSVYFAITLPFESSSHTSNDGLLQGLNFAWNAQRLTLRSLMNDAKPRG